MKTDKVLRRFLLQSKSAFEVAKGRVRLAAVLIDIDESTGKARSIERVLTPAEEE
jgi:calcineurin-like phosphoesterase